jgi:hypothetical protein
VPREKHQLLVGRGTRVADMKTLAETTTVVAATTAETTSDLERKERESRSLALEKAYVHGNHLKKNKSIY